MKQFIKPLIAILILGVGIPAFAEVSIIVHPSNAAALDKNAIKRIFLGKSRAFPGGGTAIPVTFKDGSSEATEFTKTVLSKTPKQLKAYWAKMIFTGKGTPPKATDNTAQVLELVSNNPNVIGFVLSGSENSAVKVVGKF